MQQSFLYSTNVYNVQFTLDALRYRVHVSQIALWHHYGADTLSAGDEQLGLDTAYREHQASEGDLPRGSDHRQGCTVQQSSQHRRHDGNTGRRTVFLCVTGRQVQVNAAVPWQDGARPREPISVPEVTARLVTAPYVIG